MIIMLMLHWGKWFADVEIMSGGSKEEIATPGIVNSSWHILGMGFQVPVDRLYVNICKYVIYSSIFW